LRTVSVAPSIQPTAATPSLTPSLRRSALAESPAAVSTSPRESARLPGQMERGQAGAEARAKIMWGDDPADVTKFLLTQGYSSDEAKAAIAPLLEDRARTVRKEGVHKIFTGLGMMSVPVIAFIIFQSIGVLPLKLFGATLVVGVWGAWRVLSGIIMFMSPKSEKGDVANM
jgi:hypothetical protein